MNDRFDVGEVVDVVADFSGRYPESVGQEAKIIDGPFLWIPSWTSSWVAGWAGVLTDGRVMWFGTGELRKKHPPEKTTTWDRCVWRPEKVTA